MDGMKYGRKKNKEFELYLTNHDLDVFKNKMSHIRDGKHCFKVWYGCEAKPPTLVRHSPGGGMGLTFMLTQFHFPNIINLRCISHQFWDTDLFHDKSTSVEKHSSLLSPS